MIRLYAPGNYAGGLLHPKKRCSLVSVEAYIKELRKTETRGVQLLVEQTPDMRRDREASHSIVRTWQISFQFIREVRATAAGVLSLMSLFDRHGIPIEYLGLSPLSETDRETLSLDDSENLEILEKLVSKTSRQDGIVEMDPTGRASLSKAYDEADAFSGDDGHISKSLVDDLVMLQEFSLITAQIGRTSYEMHGLV